MPSKIIPVIMCGGAGTRLWPASRESMPKQFIPLFAKRSTFQETALRLTNGDLFEKPIVITSADFRFIVADQLRQAGVEADIVLEPVRRDSAPAVAVATVLGLKRSPDGIVLILAADHDIENVNAFYAACRAALPAAKSGHIVTFGVIPTGPATDYGYLKAGQPLADGTVRKLDMFAEKPDAARAESYVAQGYLWNSGNFLFQARVMEGEFETFQPAIWATATGAVEGATRDLDFLRLAEKPFIASPKISIDYAVMEKTKCSAVVPVDMGWSDLGSWDAIWENAARDDNGNALAGPCEVLNVKNTIVQSDESILTTVIGLSDLLVVSSSDAVLVAPRTVTGEIKTLVEHLKARGRPEATEHRQVHRPWGHYTTISFGELHRVNHIVINPGQRFSLQRHRSRSEHWIIVKGTGEVTINGEVRMLQENESTYIPISTVHRLANPGTTALELIEVQVGSYLGEDDVVRIEDAYNRAD